MASLHVTKLEDDIIERLRIRATKHQVSIEEVARRILREALAPQRNIGDLAQEYFGLEYGVDVALPERAPHESLVISE